MVPLIFQEIVMNSQIIEQDLKAKQLTIRKAEDIVNKEGGVTDVSFF